MTRAAGYQGWSNYETWCVHLWLTNDYYSHYDNMAREAMEVAKSDCPSWLTIAEHAIEQLSERIKEEIAECNPLAEHNCLHSDLLQASLSSVNYQEIAKSFIDDLME